MLIEGTCAHTTGFLRRSCGNEAVGACVYCGERFCREHGEHGEDYIEVCHRKVCQAKWRDVREHQEWRDRMQVANAVSVCAQEMCQDRMEHRCQRCRLMFCRAHLKPKAIMDRSYGEPRRISAMLCAHCISRRDLWD